MSWSIEERSLLCCGTAVQFDFPIKEAQQFGEVVIVVLDVPRDHSMTENVFGVSLRGELLWQIQCIPETGTDPANCYVGVSPHVAREVHVQNWNGFVVDIDSHTGKVLRKRWFK